MIRPWYRLVIFGTLYVLAPASPASPASADFLASPPSIQHALSATLRTGFREGAMPPSTGFQSHDGYTYGPLLRRPIPDRLVVLTFDDAPVTHVTFAAKILRKYKFGATFFICEFPPNFADKTK